MRLCVFIHDCSKLFKIMMLFPHYIAYTLIIIIQVITNHKNKHGSNLICDQILIKIVNLLKIKITFDKPLAKFCVKTVV